MQALADFEVQIVLIKEEKKELIIQHDLEICNCLKADVIYGKSLHSRLSWELENQLWGLCSSDTCHIKKLEGPEAHL